MRLADALMADPYLETKSVGIELVERYHRSFSPQLLPKWKRWLAKNQSANWATTDAICGYLIGPLVVAHPSLARRVAGWARDRNMWVRRAAAVSLIPSVRKGAALDEAYGCGHRASGRPRRPDSQSERLAPARGRQDRFRPARSLPARERPRAPADNRSICDRTAARGEARRAARDHAAESDATAARSAADAADDRRELSNSASADSGPGGTSSPACAAAETIRPPRSTRRAHECQRARRADRQSRTPAGSPDRRSSRSATRRPPSTRPNHGTQTQPSLALRCRCWRPPDRGTPHRRRVRRPSRTAPRSSHACALQSRIRARASAKSAGHPFLSF